MSKDFSNPKKLGFMRLIQVMFACNVFFGIFFLTFTIKETTPLGFNDILHLLNFMFDGVCFWLIWQRKKVAREFAIAFCLFNLITGSVYNTVIGSFDTLTQVFLSSSDLILIIYFLTSRRVKAVLTQPFSLENKQEQLTQESNYYRPKTWAFWRNLIIYFCVFSVVGHWMEAGYCTLIRFGILPGIYDPNSQIWKDWLYPFLVYGFGAAACILLLYPLKNLLQKKLSGRILPLILSFIANAIVCTLIELIMGLMLNQPLPDGSLPLWDYRDMFCNFMGQVCLQNGIAFGVVATLMTWVIYPALESLLAKVSKDVMNGAFVAVVIGFCILFFFYCINIVIPEIDTFDLEDNPSQEMIEPSANSSNSASETSQ